ESFFEGQAGKSEREQVVVFIAGHANGHDENAKLHLPGRDVDFKTLISWLDGIKTKQMIVVLATPQGEAWMKKFSRPGRVILAGNGLRKHNALPVMFLKFFPAELLASSSPGEGAQSAQISLADVFLRTHQKVMEWYRTNGLYPTEEPYLEADGDGKGIVPPADEVQEAAAGSAAAGTAESERLEALRKSMEKIQGEMPDLRLAQQVLFKVPGGNRETAAK
ncbi:MAG TPA: hypothetical protein VL688_12140, partial [Verrucomicrobiae bacterium]|nr:hypothetical protein [Verrucomicrobiae bacterium]